MAIAPRLLSPAPWEDFVGKPVKLDALMEA